jgi:hypothetical protein
MAISEVITGGRDKPAPDVLELAIHRLHSLALALVSLDGTDVAGATKEEIRAAELELMDDVYREAKALRDKF